MVAQAIYSTVSREAPERCAQNLCAAVIKLAIQDAKRGRPDARDFLLRDERVEPWLWPLVPDGDDIAPYLARMRAALPQDRPAKGPLESDVMVDAWHELNSRQQEILPLLADGRSLPAIAQEIGLTTQTVKNYLHGIYRALGLPLQESGYSPMVLAARWYWERTR